ncbi:hypothetical protein [Rhodococcus sp. WMMA185]|uniref:hypothetical protein n=1 Tax=Rhodococcus sp. WMMA185 TaxID=679318 RepID=UPI0012F4CDF2|nr:hypothetical protein [Rhodococcus sp. WMMA185]
MSRSKTLDLSDRVERMGALEDRFGITLEAMYAVFKEDEYANEVRVNFDVVSPNGGIDTDLQIFVSAYNSSGQLIATTYTYVDGDDFIGLESCSERLDCDEPPTKIRVYPKSN